MCAGVAEQFAIAEAKLRAWSSVDGDESNDDFFFSEEDVCLKLQSFRVSSVDLRLPVT